ncbi:MAG: hypothetical protein LBL13_10025 [Bacteroidales bacterium]|jgi:hypothetical protein|nr:hypothetical protein [Bacteroidales bacterium]
MSEIYEYLRNNSNNMQSVFRVKQGELLFDFDNFFIIVEFSQNYKDVILEGGAIRITRHSEEFEDNYINLDEFDFTILESKEINRIFIQHGSLLHYEESEKKEFLDYYEPHTYTAYNIVKKIKTQFPNAIDTFITQPYCIDESSMCSDVWEYGFQIEINEIYWVDKDFFDYIINKVDKNLSDLSVPEFYNTEKELKDTFEVKILNHNTKIRRLGYLKILLKMLKEQSKVPVSKINTKFEKYCQDYNQYLELHKNKKGNVIVTRTGNSANPYIELAVSLGLIHNAAGAYEVGKIGKVYNILKDKIDEQNMNPFIFSKFDITFFLELLLKKDYWFLYAILEQAAINPSIAYKKLKKGFKQILLEQIGQFIDEAQNANHSKQVLPLKITERRINDWKKPEVYMEHVLMPRLNWLYDMELIDLKNDLSFQLTETGTKLLYNLAVWNDIALHRIVSPHAYIDNYFMKIINFVFDTQKQRCTKEIDAEFEKCLNDSFLLFKTLAPNRVTFSLFAYYTKQMLFWNNIGIVDTENIKKVFERKQISNYIYKYQEHYKDGYIQKNN